MKRAPRDPKLARRWQAFVRNHRDAMAAMDFFTVPTVTFQLLYCFFIISHERRQILHVNVTRHPTSTWIAQQLREAFPYESAPRFLLFDHDKKYGLEVPAALRSLQITAVQTSIQSPWQNGVAERWVGSCRRDPRLLEYRAERAGPDAYEPGGLYAGLKLGSACILPYLDEKQTQTVIEAIYKRFPDMLTVAADTKSPFGQHFTTLGI